MSRSAADTAGSTAPITGTSGNDTRGGNDRLEGGDGKDRLLGVERLVSSDGALALDTGASGIAGQAYRI